MVLFSYIHVRALLCGDGLACPGKAGVHGNEVVNTERHGLPCVYKAGLTSLSRDTMTAVFHAIIYIMSDL